MEDNTYLLGKMVTAEAELARLVDQSRVIGEVIGDLFPPSVDVDPSLFRRVLDIGSGSGDWCLEVAQALPNSEVCGIDLTPYMVNYARAQAECRGLQVEFQVMNALERLKFSDGTFDLINMRFGASFVLNSLWASLFQEVKRLLRPGGVFVCTEIDLGVTNSAAWGQMLQWIAGVGHVRNIAAGKGFSIGTVAMLGKHFQDAHFAPIEYYPYFWDASVWGQCTMRAGYTMP